MIQTCTSFCIALIEKGIVLALSSNFPASPGNRQAPVAESGPEILYSIEVSLFLEPPKQYSVLTTVCLASQALAMFALQFPSFQWPDGIR